MEHFHCALSLRFLIKLAGPTGFYKCTPLSWLSVRPCNADEPQWTRSQSTERSRAWQRCNFPPLKAQLPPGDLYRTLQVKPSFCLQVAGRKKGSEEGRKETNFPFALTCSRPYTHGALDGPEVSRVFGCVFLRTKVVIVSEVCRGRKANIVLCESEWKGKARLRQQPRLAGV